MQWRDEQGIIKVKEWISRIGLLPKVIPSKLSLGIVPSSSGDVTGSMREQPKLSHFPATTWDEMVGNGEKSHFMFYFSRDFPYIFRYFLHSHPSFYLASFR